MSEQFSPSDLDWIRRTTFVEQVEFHREIGSTNDRALQIAGEGGRPLPLLVLAERQTAGRGRGENRWWGAEGGLTFSVLLRPGAQDLPPRLWPQASLTVGLAVCEALESLLSAPARIGLKWPNDVLLQDRKVCGVLVETAGNHQEELLVLGIGINVNNSLQDGPRELRSTATALCDVLGRPSPLTDVLFRVLERLWLRFSWIGSRDKQLRELWRERCLLTNRRVHLDQGTRQVVGLCRGIDDQGALVLETDQGSERCFAGVVVRYE